MRIDLALTTSTRGGFYPSYYVHLEPIEIGVVAIANKKHVAKCGEVEEAL